MAPLDPGFRVVAELGDAWAERLRLGDLRAVPRSPHTEERVLYDTADGRLRAAGLGLEHAGGQLVLAGAEGEQAVASVGPPAPRYLAAELPEGRLRDRLAPLLHVRALVPRAHVRCRLRRIDVLDGEEKTVVRLVEEEPALAGPGHRHRPLTPRVRVVGVRGYPKALRRVRRTLEGEAALAPATVALADEAAAAAGTPARPACGPPALTPDDRADAAAAAVCARLLATIRADLDGALADVDTEFLHDVRVAVRRTRTVQRQLAGVFPAAALPGHRADFRRLQQVTGPTRDLDVHLLALDPAAPELGPLREVLTQRRERERAAMAGVLRSAPAERALASWGWLLDGLAAAPAEDRPDAARPIAAVAGGRIARTYRSMVREGRAIGPDSPAESLHDLRKRGKELRYLLELFGGVFDEAVVAPLVKALKGLQTTLGHHQDTEVQAALLRETAADVARRPGGAEALLATGRVVDALEAEQAAARAEFADRFDHFAAREHRVAVRDTFAP